MIDSLQTAIGNFIHLGDDYCSQLPPQEWDIEGTAIREMQRRIARINNDLSGLYRRLDT